MFPPPLSRLLELSLVVVISRSFLISGTPFIAGSGVAICVDITIVYQVAPTRIGAMADSACLEAHMVNDSD